MRRRGRASEVRCLLASCLAVLACGPSIGSGTGSGTESEGATADTAASHTSAASAETVDTDATGPTDGEEFSCPSGEELVPGYCFERYDIVVPGPLVMERATGADLDGDGVDALALELELGGDHTLTVWHFDPAYGVALDQEVAYVHENDPVGPSEGEFEGTRLLAGRHDPTVDAGELSPEAVYRTELEAIRVCVAEEGAVALTCAPKKVPSVRPDPIVVGYMVTCCGGDDLIIPGATTDNEPGGVAMLGGGAGFWGVQLPTEPCPSVTALAYGDVDADGEGDVVYRSTTDCIDETDPRHRDVGLYVGAGIDPGPFIDPGVDVDLLLGIDPDGDGVAEVLAVARAGPSAQYRVLSWAGAEPTVTQAVGPARVDRLDQADLHGDGTAEILYVEDRTHLSSSAFEPPVALPSALGRLLAVIDVDGDGLDDLLMSGPDPGASLILLISR